MHRKPLEKIFLYNLLFIIICKCFTLLVFSLERILICPIMPFPNYWFIGKLFFTNNTKINLSSPGRIIEIWISKVRFDDPYITNIAHYLESPIVRIVWCASERQKSRTWTECPHSPNLLGGTVVWEYQMRALKLHGYFERAQKRRSWKSKYTSWKQRSFPNSGMII